MYSQEHHIISSDEEEAVVPLKLIRSNILMLPEPPEDPNSYEELYKYSMEKCEFCDSIFHCRYDVIIHNATHIIVPLINQTTFECNICLHVFTSERDLHHHKYLKHNVANPPKVLLSVPRKESGVKYESYSVPQVLESLIRKDPIVKCDDSVTMLMKKSVNLKSRLVFEDDADDDVICLDDEQPSSTFQQPSCTNGYNFVTNVNNLIQDIVNHKLGQPLNGEVHSNKGTQNVTPILQNAAPKLKLLTPSEVNMEKSPPSIHYEQLIKPGLYRCKRCPKTFPNSTQQLSQRPQNIYNETGHNRDQLDTNQDQLNTTHTVNVIYTHIIHEANHMKFKSQVKSHLCTLCDKHIAGSRATLNNHMNSFHPFADLSRNRAISVCLQCNLKYHNSWRHALQFHRVFLCNYCPKQFTNSVDLTTHNIECKKSCALFKNCADNELQKKDLPAENEDHFDILRVCEVCALFLKDKQNLKYVCVGENSKLECDQVCEQCNKEAYVIKLIKRVRTNMKFKGQYKVRTLSNNENRLKNIQQRLKLMNKLSRF